MMRSVGGRETWHVLQILLLSYVLVLSMSFGLTYTFLCMLNGIRWC